MLDRVTIALLDEIAVIDRCTRAELIAQLVRDGVAARVTDEVLDCAGATSQGWASELLRSPR